MPFEINKERVLNSPEKVLKSAYAELKESSTNMDILKYEALYRSKPLSFILENSRFIFGEPTKGYGFYKNIVENCVLPLNSYEDEMVKVESYLDEFKPKMSKEQAAMYESLLSILESKCNDELCHTTGMYLNMMEETESMNPFYDALYEYQMNHDDDSMEILENFFESNQNKDVMDAMMLGIKEPDMHSHLYRYLSECYTGKSDSVEECMMNTMTTNIVRRMMKDSYVRESVSNIGNTNLRHLIQGIAGNDQDMNVMESITVEVAKDSDQHYASPELSVNRMFDDYQFSNICAEENATEKYNRLACEKAVLEVSLGFSMIDEMCDFDYIENTLIEHACFEDANIEKIPNTAIDQISFLESMICEIEEEMESITEQYFSNDFGPSKVVAQSIGNSSSTDSNTTDNKSHYTPKTDSEKSDVNDDNTKLDIDDSDSDSDDE